TRRCPFGRREFARRNRQMYCERHQQIGARLAAAMLAIAALAITTAPAVAAIDDASFTMKVSEREKALSEPTNMEVQKFLMWDLGADRVAARNMPFIELFNDSTSDAPITEFKLTIGDPRFTFSCEMVGGCAALGKPTPGFSLTSSLADSGDTLVVGIGNGGLDPGEAIRFRIALGVDAGFNFYKAPDFR